MRGSAKHTQRQAGTLRLSVFRLGEPGPFFVEAATRVGRGEAVATGRRGYSPEIYNQLLALPGLAPL